MKQVPVTIILIAHNEEETIEQEVQNYFQTVVSKLPGSELIIAEDGSTDKTREILQKLQKKYSLVLLTSRMKRGYAASLRLALEKAKGEAVLYADAGNKHSPKDFWKLYKQLSAFDLLSGQKAKRHDPWYRLVLAYGLNMVVTLYFGLQSKDVDSGFKLFKKSVKEKILSKPWILKNNISLEIMLRAHYQGVKIKEIPIQHKARKFGTSRGIPAGKIPSIVIDLLRQFPTLKREMNKVKRSYEESVMIQNYNTMFPSGDYRIAWEGKISVVYKLPKYLKIMQNILGKKKQSVLEVGAGDGEIAYHLLSDTSSPISSYIVTEYAALGVRQAKKVLAKFKHVVVKKMDASNLLARDKSVDTVFAIDVMHHVVDPQKMGQEMIRVSKNKVFLLESNALSVARRAAQLQERYKQMGEKSYYPWEYRRFFANPRVKTFSIQPFLFMVPRIPESFIPINIFISELMEKIPLLKWQCSGVIITVTLKK